MTEDGRTRAERAAHWFAADFHLTRLLEHSPDHAGLHVRRAHARMHLLHDDLRRWFTTMPRAVD
jgi:hypothetical protein